MSRQALIKNKILLRSKIIRLIRNFFHNNEYCEIETPIRIPAPAPESNIEPVSSDGWFLQTSPELCMKRLLASGYKKIFQITKAFRKNERGNKHLPEMTLLEWYTAGDSYIDLMAQCEALIKYIAENLNILKDFKYKSERINLESPWEKLSVSEAFFKYSGKNAEKAVLNNTFNEILALEVEPELGLEKPLFLYDYPAELAALARKKESNPLVAERFELYISGIELCNGFSELTDPIEQRKRFEEEVLSRKKNGYKTWNLPEDFLNSLQFMPEAAGIAMGIDRLVMLFTDSESIDEVVAFTPEDISSI